MARKQAGDAPVKTPAPATLAPVNLLLFGDNLQWLRDAKIFPDANVNICRPSYPANYRI
jgi:hypothetical protein